MDLPWEWRDPYRIRNALYPIYLSWPLALLKFFKMDFPYLVLISPYIAHWPLMMLSDYYLWQIGKRVVGKPATRIAFILLLTNLYMIEFEIRCFTNTLEKIMTVTCFYFYLQQGNSFTLNTAIFTALLTLSFMMRNTSPVGWIPLLFLKIYRDGAFVPFLLAGIFVFVPVTFGCVYLDSLYYWGANTSSTGTSLDARDTTNKEFEWTYTSLNFLRVNVLQGLSKYFGDHNLLVYVKNFLPEVLRASTPFAYLGFLFYAKDVLHYGHHPEIVYLAGFYIIFFSLIGHKEPRFMLPIAPFLFLVSGYFLEFITKLWPRTIRFYIWASIAVDSLLFVARVNFHDRYWDAMDYIVNVGDTPPHSIYTMHRFETPYYSWLHQRGLGYDPSVNRTKLYVVQQGPIFAREAFGAPMMVQNPDYTSYYIESIAKLIDGEMRPEWILIPQRFHDCGQRYYCSEAALAAIKNLGKEKPEDEPMYTIAKVFGSEIVNPSPHARGLEGVHLGRRYLFKLNTNKY